MQVLEAELETGQRHRCAMCKGLRWVTIDVREADGTWWYTTVDCPMCGHRR